MESGISGLSHVSVMHKSVKITAKLSAVSMILFYVFSMK